MQTTPITPSVPGGSTQSWDPTPMYNHQRTSSNPRTYAAAPDAPLPVPPMSARRDESSNQVYEEGFNYPSNSNYVGGQYNNYGNVGLPNYTSTVPARRTSGSNNKPSTPPSAPVNTQQAQQSPSSRYYTQAETQTSPATHIPTASPYQASSAPPQVLSHQPQTAHSYGNNYYPTYYDQQHQNWYPNFPPQPSTSRSAPVASSTTPTIPQNPVENRRTPTTATSTAYDYNSQYYNRDQWQNSGGPSRVTSQAAPGPWQYGQYPPPVAPPPQAQYGWNPAWNQGYYPPAPVVPLAVPTKKPKKEKKDAKSTPPVNVDYAGLGKREPESTEDEADHKKKPKKGKKEKQVPEPPVIKAPAKSHLHPPRQANSAWQLFFTDELNKAKAAAASGSSPGGTPHAAKLNVAQIAKDAGAAYANLSPEQRDYYAAKVQESKEQYARDLAIWQSTLTPDDIRAENAFRAQQRKEGKSRKGNLKDPNAPKKPLSAYFLFLKGIREDEELRKGVWGDESETTRQSVLAAERWRGLTDEEKKPYLQQADKDKQEYEALRKIYEDEAAARARGEDLPPRPIIIPEVPKVNTDPKPRRKKEKPTLSAIGVEGDPSSSETKPDISDPALDLEATLNPTASDLDIDTSFDVEDFTNDNEDHDDDGDDHMDLPNTTTFDLPNTTTFDLPNTTTLSLPVSTDPTLSLSVSASEPDLTVNDDGHIEGDGSQQNPSADLDMSGGIPPETPFESIELGYHGFDDMHGMDLSGMGGMEMDVGGGGVGANVSDDDVNVGGAVGENEAVWGDLGGLMDVGGSGVGVGIPQEIDDTRGSPDIPTIAPDLGPSQGGTVEIDGDDLSGAGGGDIVVPPLTSTELEEDLSVAPTLEEANASVIVDQPLTDNSGPDKAETEEEVQDIAEQAEGSLVVPPPRPVVSVTTEQSGDNDQSPDGGVNEVEGETKGESAGQVDHGGQKDGVAGVASGGTSQSEGGSLAVLETAPVEGTQGGEGVSQEVGDVVDNV